MRDIESLHGVSPNVSLSCEPWGLTNHNGRDCECLSSDSMGAYVHDLSLATKEASPVEEQEDLSRFPCGDGLRESQSPRISALCVSPARRLRPPTPGRVRAVEDGPFGGV